MVYNILEESNSPDLLYKVVINPQDRAFYEKIKKHVNGLGKGEGILDDWVTLGVKFGVVIENIDDKKVDYQLWIMNPDDRFKETQKMYRVGANFGMVLGDDADKVNELVNELSDSLEEVIVMNDNLECIVDRMQDLTKQELLYQGKC